MSLSKIKSGLARFKRDLASNCSGIAIVEFASAAPFLVLTFLTGMEIANYTVTKMRVNQVALQIADNGARIGTVPPAGGSEEITEADINDVLTGGALQASSLDLYTHGRVIISSLEPTANTDTNTTYKIRWQRCRGLKNSTSSYGVQGATNLTGMGPSGQRAKASVDQADPTTHIGIPTAVIYVQIFYDYQPLFSQSLVPTITFNEVAAMGVRGQRNYTGPTSGTNANLGIFTVSGVTASTCNLFTAT